MKFNKGALLFLAAQSTVTLTSAFVTPTAGLKPFGVSPQKSSFVTRVSAEPIEAADEAAVEEIPQPEMAETEEEDVVAEAEEAESEEEDEVEPEADEAAASEEDEVVAEESADETPAAEEEAPQPRVRRERITCFVGNLNFDTTDAEVRDLFAEQGKVELVSVPRDASTGNSRGFAFVDMSTKEELEACIENLNGIEFGGRIIRVANTLSKDEIQKKKEMSADGSDGMKKIYVGNLPFDSTQEELTDFYGEYGEVKEVYIPTDINTGRPRGFAFISMAKEDAEKAIEATNGVQFQGRTISVSEPLPRGKKAPPRVYPQRTKIYVGNLSFYTTLDTVQGLFEEYGEVYDCYMPADRETGASRGFAFVTMEPEFADNAIMETDGFELDGRIIRVNVAQPKFAERPKYEDDDVDGYDDVEASGDFDDGDAYEEEESYDGDDAYDNSYDDGAPDGF